MFKFSAENETKRCKEVHEKIFKEKSVKLIVYPNQTVQVRNLFYNFFYRQRGCLAFSLRFWPKLRNSWVTSQPQTFSFKQLRSRYFEQMSEIIKSEINSIYFLYWFVKNFPFFPEFNVRILLTEILTSYFSCRILVAHVIAKNVILVLISMTTMGFEWIHLLAA